MRCRHLTGSIAALAVALFFATTALANGEPKNRLPFTAGVAQSTSAPDWFERYATAHPYGRNLNRPALSSVAGAPKNALPFTRFAARTNAGPDVFERYAAAHPYGASLSATTSTVAPSRGFHWRDALIGAAAAAGLALLCATGLGVGRSRRRNHVAHAIGA
jgi:hypothetical protein